MSTWDHVINVIIFLIIGWAHKDIDHMPKILVWNPENPHPETNGNGLKRSLTNGRRVPKRVLTGNG
jgi:hypothetical protein